MRQGIRIGRLFHGSHDLLRDGDIDAEDDLIGDLLLYEYMQENEHLNYRPTGQQSASGEMNPWTIAIGLFVFLIIGMIICSNSV